MGIFSMIMSFFRSMRGLRYAFRLLTGKRMGFSLRGPAGMRLHYNSDGSLRSLSLRSCAGMRVVVGSNGKFKGLSIPGPLKGTRVFTNSSGELTGFGLPRLFGGFLLYDAHGKLKRTYGPVVKGTCLSYDDEGNKKKHTISAGSKDSFIESEARVHIPGSEKSYTKRGEVTEKGIVPIKDSDLYKFTVKKEKPEVKAEKPTVTETKEQTVRKDIGEVAKAAEKKFEGSSEYKEIKRSDIDPKKQMDETYKELDEIAKGRDEVSFDELL